MSDSQTRWALVGKAAAVLAATASLIGVLLGMRSLYDWYISPSVTAAYRSMVYALDPKVRGMLRERVAREDVLRMIDDLQSKEVATSEIVESVKGYVAPDPDDDLQGFVLNSLVLTRGLFEFTVSNPSGSMVRGVELHLGSRGTAAISESTIAVNAEEVEWDKVVPIGDIAPGGSRTVWVWHEGLFLKSPAIVHDRGVGRVYAAQEMYGPLPEAAMWFWNASLFVQIPVAVFLLLLLGLPGAWALHRGLPVGRDFMRRWAQVSALGKSNSRD